MTIRIKTDNQGRQVISSSNPVLVTPLTSGILTPITQQVSTFHNAIGKYRVKCVERSIYEVEVIK